MRALISRKASMLTLSLISFSLMFAFFQNQTLPEMIGKIEQIEYENDQMIK